jgi:hypothetical protein
MTMRTIAVVTIAMVVVAALLAAAYFSRGDGGDTSATIRDTLVGTNLTYYSIAGKPMNYTIGPEDIGSIEPTTFEGKNAWKVRVGQGLAWDLTMDASGREILYVDQLFRT